ncbi:MAG TPA: chemotaxis protein CheW [Stenotrophobium sp.]|jgi:twitching motility protein PilI|nr:chemotaxis protein CheW [Stenotrophobium sp.]
MTSELRSLRDQPFDLLQRLESQLQVARLDVVAGQAQGWTGLGFRLGDTWLVAPRDDVREIIAPPKLTRIPNAKPWLLGVANVRGALLGVIDLNHFLGAETATASRAQRLLVYNSDRVPVGFLVDEIVGHRQFTANEQRAELPEGSEPFLPYLLGAFVRDGQPWLAFSLHKLAMADTFGHAGL